MCSLYKKTRTSHRKKSFSTKLCTTCIGILSVPSLKYINAVYSTERFANDVYLLTGMMADGAVIVHFRQKEIRIETAPYLVTQPVMEDPALPTI